MKIAAIVSGLLFLIGALTACNGSKVTPTPGPGPTPTPNGKMIEKTVPELISEVLKNPNKYKIDTLIRVSGVMTDKEESGISSVYFYLGPPVEGFYVIIKVFRTSSQWDALRKVQAGENVVVETRYSGFAKDWQGVILTFYDGELISKK